MAIVLPPNAGLRNTVGEPFVKPFTHSIRRHEIRQHIGIAAVYADAQTKIVLSVSIQPQVKGAA